MTTSHTMAYARVQPNDAGILPNVVFPEVHSVREFVVEEPESIQAANGSSDSTLRQSSPSSRNGTKSSGPQATLENATNKQSETGERGVDDLQPGGSWRQCIMTRLQEARDAAAKHKHAAEVAQQRQINMAKAVGAAGAEAFEETQARKRAELEIEMILTKLEHADKPVALGTFMEARGINEHELKASGKERLDPDRIDESQPPAIIDVDSLQHPSLESPTPRPRHPRLRGQRAISPTIVEDEDEVDVFDALNDWAAPRIRRSHKTWPRHPYHADLSARSNFGFDPSGLDLDHHGPPLPGPPPPPAPPPPGNRQDAYRNRSPVISSPRPVDCMPPSSPRPPPSRPFAISHTRRNRRRPIIPWRRCPSPSDFIPDGDHPTRSSTPENVDWKSTRHRRNLSRTPSPPLSHSRRPRYHPSPLRVPRTEWFFGGNGMEEHSNKRNRIEIVEDREERPTRRVRFEASAGHANDKALPDAEFF